MTKTMLILCTILTVFLSCKKQHKLIGKWQMKENSHVINFINDSFGYIENNETMNSPKIKQFRYKWKGDTLFEETQHVFGKRKWLILKLTEDSLIISMDNSKVQYQRLYQ